MDRTLTQLAMELGEWPKNAQDAKQRLEGSGWFYQPKTGAVKHHATRRVVMKPEWRAERQRLEQAAQCLEQAARRLSMSRLAA